MATSAHCLCRQLAAILLGVLSSWSTTQAAAERHCSGSRIAVQVLGSGGPVADDARASSGYLVWVDGRARVLVDAGGGVSQRFGAAGARVEDLQHVAITHFHADHSADLAALVKSGYFSARRRPLTVSGPGGDGEYPSLREFLNANFSASEGVYGYLSGALDGTGGLFRLLPREADPAVHDPLTVSQDGGIVVQAIGVPHGPVPALGYVVTIGRYRIAFSGDQNASRDDFWRLARGADLLVMHLAVPEGAGRIARNLHAVPSRIGRRAREAGIRRLVLSHLMQRSLKRLDDSLRIIRTHFDGELRVAEDLACYALPSGSGG